MARITADSDKAPPPDDNYFISFKTHFIVGGGEWALVLQENSLF